MSPFCSVSSLPAAALRDAGPGGGAPACVPPLSSGPPHPEDPWGHGDVVTYLGDSARKSNLRRAAFIWGGEWVKGGGAPPWPSQTPPRKGPHLLLLPLDSLCGVPKIRQAGEGAGPEVCKEGGVTLGGCHGVGGGTRRHGKGARGAPNLGLNLGEGLTSAGGHTAPLPGQPQPPPLHAGAGGRVGGTGGALQPAGGQRAPAGDSG